MMMINDVGTCGQGDKELFTGSMLLFFNAVVSSIIFLIYLAKNE